MTGCPSTRTSTGLENANMSDPKIAKTRVAASVVLDGLRYLMSVLRIFFGDNLLDFKAKRPQQLPLGERAHQLAGPVDGAFPLSAGDADVGHLGLAGAVDDAPHHGDLHRSGVLLGDGLDGAAEFEH